MNSSLVRAPDKKQTLQMYQDAFFNRCIEEVYSERILEEKGLEGTYEALQKFKISIANEFKKNLIEDPVAAVYQYKALRCTEKYTFGDSYIFLYDKEITNADDSVRKNFFTIYKQIFEEYNSYFEELVLNCHVAP